MEEACASIAYLHLDGIDDRFRDDCRARLDAIDTARLARFVVQRARDEYLAGRALLRTVLSSLAGIAPQAWRFRPDKYGRPYITAPASCAGLRFSVSHAPGLAACAVARESRIGVDVEHTGGQVDRKTLGQAMLTVNEIGQIDALPPREQDQRFFTLWTLKEAYAKALGRGFSFPMKSLEFQLQSDDIALRIVRDAPKDGSQWRFVSARPSGNHVMAIAIEISTASGVPGTHLLAGRR